MVKIKHTNSKAIVTIYIYNKEKLSLLKKIRKFRNLLVIFMVLLIDKNKLENFISLPWIINQDLINNSSILWRLANYKVRDDFFKVDNMLYFRLKRLAKNLYKILTTIRIYRLRLSLNRYKLEEQLLYKLSQRISKYYGKIKHTNSKAIVTIYIYNKEKLSLLKKIRKFRNLLVIFMVLLIDKNKLENFISLPWIINQDLINNSSILWRLANYKVRDDFFKVDNMLYFRLKRLAKNLYKILTTIRIYRLRLSLNRYKLEEQLLYKLSQRISKYYGKNKTY